MRPVALAALALLAPAVDAGSATEGCGQVAPFVIECRGTFTFEGELAITLEKLFLGDLEVRLRQPGREYVVHCGLVCGETGQSPLPGVATDFACRALPGEGGLGPAGAWGCGFTWA